MIFSIFYFHYATKYTNILFVLLFALCSGIVSLCSGIRSTAAGRQFILTTGPISEHHFGSYGFPPPLPFPSVGTPPPPFPLCWNTPPLPPFNHLHPFTNSPLPLSCDACHARLHFTREIGVYSPALPPPSLFSSLLLLFPLLTPPPHLPFLMSPKIQYFMFKRKF